MNSPGTWTYSYDAAGQVVHAVFASTNASIASQDLAYKNDAAGNRIETIFNGAVNNYAADGLNQYTSADGTIYSYDADGNLVSSNAGGQITGYAYDSLNQLTSLTAPDGTVTTYGYDALGNRVSQTVGGVSSTYVIDPKAIASSATGPLSSIAEVYNSSGQVTAIYDYGNGLASVTEGGATYYYNGDASGNVTSLSGAGGALVDSYNYGPFGSTLSTTGAVANPFQYAGIIGETTSSGGLIYMRARVYDPALGRFLSQDASGLTQGSNLYAYAGNSPIQYVDPTGYWFINIGVSGGFGIGGAGGVLIGPGGIYPYLGGGATTPGVGVGVTVSPGDPSPGWGYTIQGAVGPGVFGGAGAIDLNSDGAFNTFEVGGGAGLAGSKATGVAGYAIYTFGPLFGPSGNPTNVIPVQSVDPNEIIGPTAYGAQNFVAAGALLSYTIDFQNSTTASAPAQAVTVTQQLDSSLDWRTFRLTGFGFDNLTTSLSGASPFYSGLIDYSATKGYDVEVTAGVNVQTGVVTWNFQTIDPTTGVAPTNPQLGLLPVDDSFGDGEGFVSYTVKARTSDPTGTTIAAQAQVVFDTNGPIDTPTVTDTVDSVAPTSAVEALPSQSATTTFEVLWSGQDDAAGSGIGSYTIFVSEDGGSQTAWLADTTRTNALFAGDLGHVYAFDSQATDNAGNQEASHASADATIEVGAVAPTGLALTQSSEQGSSPNVTGDITPTITGSADAGANVTLSMAPMSLEPLSRTRPQACGA